MPFVSDRWLGGTLTNFRTIRSRLGRLEELEGLRASEELFATYSKKMQSSLNREYRRMYRNLNGIRTMNRLPECVVTIDPMKEKNAIKEAQKLGITTVSLIDTNCDPDEVDLPIPGQRRQHPLDRVGGEISGRRGFSRQSGRRRLEGSTGSGGTCCG